MVAPWWRTPVVPDRSIEIARATVDNARTRAQVESLRRDNFRRFARVSRIADALVHEGGKNHFTQRIEAAIRKGGVNP